jgi:ketosteroid isomerase-like protein
MLSLPVVCAALLATVHPATPHPATPRHEADLDSLIASERAFSQHSVDHGMRDAFLAYLAENAIIMRPLPMKGRPVWEARQPSPATLVWEPSYAEVSGGGDLGVTSGPWEFRPPAGPDTTVLHGHFISVWRKQEGGRWKVEVDLGGSHEKPSRGGVGSGEIRRGPIHADPPAKDRSKQAVHDIAAAEKRFSGAARRAGLTAVMAGWTTEDLRFHREGHLPWEGRDASRSAVTADSTAVFWTPMGSGAASSGDLGYTYGIRIHQHGAAPDSSVYLNVWRRERDGKWRVSLMVDNPLK